MNTLELAKSIQAELSKNGVTVFITGSCSLIAQGKLSREASDIDFMANEKDGGKIHIVMKALGASFSTTLYGNAYGCQFKLNGIKIDFFYANYFTVDTRLVEGHGDAIFTSVYSIVQAKRMILAENIGYDYADKTQIEKCKRDLAEMGYTEYEEFMITLESMHAQHYEKYTYEEMFRLFADEGVDIEYYSYMFEEYSDLTVKAHIQNGCIKFEAFGIPWCLELPLPF